MKQAAHVPIQVEHHHPGVVRVSAQKAWTDPLPPDCIEGRTLTSLVSPGTELEMLQQEAPGPRVLGYAAVIEVERTGQNVSSIAPGQRVFALAPHQTLQRVSEDHAIVIPDGLPPEEAVFARFVAVPSPSLMITRARPSHRVLIAGLGIVGNMAAQVFRATGYAVTAVDPVARRRELAALVGLTDIHEHVPRDAEFSLAVDCSGHERAVVEAARALTPGGELILVGAPWRAHAPEITAHELLDVIFHRRLTARSGWEYQLPFLRGDAPVHALSGSVREVHATALRWLSEGRISVRGLVDAAAPSDAERVYADLRTSNRLSTRFDWT